MGFNLNEWYEKDKRYREDLEMLRVEGIIPDHLIESSKTGSATIESEAISETLLLHGTSDKCYEVPRENYEQEDKRYLTQRPDIDDYLWLKAMRTIEENEVYDKAKRAIFEAQIKQVAYGLEKYPEPLNHENWSAVEAIDHIIEESVDKLHYLVMLKIKLEEMEKK